MNLKPIKANLTELETLNGYILFSYKTPVVVTIKSTGEVYVTDKFWSRTTSKHISFYLKQFGVDENYKTGKILPLSRLKMVSQEKLEGMVV